MNENGSSCQKLAKNKLKRKFFLVKFRYCEKAKTSEKIFHLFLKLLSAVKAKWDIFGNSCGLPRISELYQ